MEPTAEDWGALYAGGVTPWDVGDPHPELMARLEAGKLGEPGTALVPGCGLGHDAVALAQAGWMVTAVDFAAELADIVPDRLAPFGGAFLDADALDLDIEPVDLIFDHTFFCAIHPTRRPDHGAMVRRLLRQGGTLASIVFPRGEPIDGPPWGMEPRHVLAVLGEGFTIVADEPVDHPVLRRHSREGWLEVRRDS